MPIRSNVQKYGPWYITSAYGVTHAEQDEGLVPSEYGSSTNMNQAGFFKALNGTASAMQIGETGQIEVPGYPTIALGAELGSYNGIGGTNLVENRSIETQNSSVGNGQYGIINIGGPWSGVYGPNITSINVQVGLSQVTTQYQMRTFTTSFGRFSRNNAERMKQYGQNNLTIQKQLRLANLTLTE